MAAKKMQGGCQCGKVRFEATVDIDQTITCNCSRCSRLGSILTFTSERDFKLLSGKEALTDFQFHKKVIHHEFCSTCGIQSFAHGAAPDGMQMVAVNVRCLDGVDPTTLSPQSFDGRSA